MSTVRSRLVPILLVLGVLASGAVGVPTRFEVRFDPAVRDHAYTGRVYVALAPGSEGPEPRQAMHAWFNPPPVFAVDVVGLEPGATVTLDERALAHPAAMPELDAGPYRVQAVLRVNPDSPQPGLGEGDLVSAPVTIGLDPGEGWAITLTADRAVTNDAPRDSDRVRYFEVVSPLLSAFHGREVKMRAGVVVPPGFDQRRGERFPTVYFVTGFGGDHTFAEAIARSGLAGDPGAQQALWIVPDPTCYRGHSVFADSATNGPWGRALVEELIPAVESEFGGAGPEHRYVTGVSSGGWSSLWLQLTYPEHFAGCWSHVPDPVGLHHFQTLDVYADGANMFVDEHGAERPIARQNGQVMLTSREFVARETVLGPGGQIHSFEAVWSPRLPDGSPRPLFDRATGVVDPVTADAWKAYDVAKVVRTTWDRVAPHLPGKVHVYAGEQDNFYLEGAIPELAEAFAAVGSDAVVEVVPGMGHTLHRAGHQDLVATMTERWSHANAREPAHSAP